MTNLKLNELLHGGDYNPDQWLDHPEVIDKDFKLFEEADINTVTLAVFAWSKLEPTEGKYHFEWLDNIFDRVEAHNGHVILSTPSGARPRWLAEKYPEVLRVNSKGERALFGERHNHCYTSSIYREKVQQINRKLAERYGNRKGLLMWHISNEFGGECHCDLCQEAFREWLKNKYQTLDNLNHAYWSGFWSHNYTDWMQVHSPSPLGDQTFIGLNLDWKRFVTERTISFFDAEIEPLRELTPDVPVTTNFMGGNPPESHIFYDLDYQEFAKHVDVVSWDSYPNWANDYQSTKDLGMKTGLMNDVMRSLKHQNYLIMESTPTQVNWHPYNRSKRPGMHEMGSLQQIAHGADSVLYFQLHQARGASEMYHGAVITHNMSNQTRGFQDVKQVGRDLVQLKNVSQTSRQSAKVAIVFDYDNMWALDDARNYANKTKKYWRTIQEQYRYFWEHDIPVEIISVEDDLTPYKLVIDPMHFMMSTKFAEKLQQYVTGGGHLVGTYITGMVDKNFLAYLGGWPKALHETYGIEFSETDTLYPSQHNHIKYQNQSFEVSDYCDLFTVETAKTLAIYQDDFYANYPAITVNDLGDGQAYYLGARTGNDLLSNFYDRLVKQLDLVNTMPISKQSSTINIQIRENDTTRYYFVINYSHEGGKMLLTKKLKNEFSGEVANIGKQEIRGYGVNVYSEPK
ncbi:beta-galactosidase [Secundilactobacillus hailunensis]|uniref:Beta-galactosidase n=1 Tax=Secundilactobacillus hailunensis TaxID=2559923 RepID=A0ABW1T8N2_9LACO|nr:beta-galactosidase [Secundilactobacillus hailunensis]